MSLSAFLVGLTILFLPLSRDFEWINRTGAFILALAALPIILAMHSRNNTP